MQDTTIVRAHTSIDVDTLRHTDHTPRRAEDSAESAVRRAGIYNFKLVSGDNVAGPGVGNTGNTATDFGLNGGAGFDIKAGGVGFFAEGRFHDVFSDGPNAKFIPITVGIRLGGN